MPEERRKELIDTMKKGRKSTRRKEENMNKRNGPGGGRREEGESEGELIPIGLSKGESKKGRKVLEEEGMRKRKG